MEHMIVMHVADGFADLEDGLRDILLGLGLILNIIPKRTRRKQLHNQVNLLVVVEASVEGGDVVVIKKRLDLDLPHQIVRLELSQFVLFDNLQHTDKVQFLLQGKEGLPIRALSKLFYQLKVLKRSFSLRRPDVNGYLKGLAFCRAIVMRSNFCWVEHREQLKPFLGLAAFTFAIAFFMTFCMFLIPNEGWYFGMVGFLMFEVALRSGFVGGVERGYQILRVRLLAFVSDGWDCTAY
jgi:hypothetical protein